MVVWGKEVKKILLIISLLTVTIEAQSTIPVGYEFSVYKQNESSPIIAFEINNINCRVVQIPTPTPTSPVILSQMMKLIWGDTTECESIVGNSLQNIPIYDQSYIGKMRAYSLDGTNKVWSNYTISNNPFYQPPPNFIATCSQNLTASTANSVVAVNWQAPITNGGISPISSVCSPPSGSNFPVGVNTVNCSATDGINRTTTCAFTITVTQSIPPPSDIIPPSVTMTVKRSGNSSNYVVTATAKDNIKVTEIRYLLDGLLKNFIADPLITTSYTMKINESGSHIIKVEAKDAAQNIGVSQQTINR